jgi:hypothetical protein
VIAAPPFLEGQQKMCLIFHHRSGLANPDLGGRQSGMFVKTCQVFEDILAANKEKVVSIRAHQAG